MSRQPPADDAAPEIEPQHTLTAMREIRQSMVKACGQLRTLLQEPQPDGRVRDVIADMVAYSEQLQFLCRPPAPIAKASEPTLAAIEDIAALQNRILDAWGEFAVLAQQYRLAGPAERNELHAEFRELSARMFANAKAVCAVLEPYHPSRPLGRP